MNGGLMPSANAKKHDAANKAEFLNWAQAHGQPAVQDGVNIRIPQPIGQDLILPPDAEYELPRFSLERDGLD